MTYFGYGRPRWGLTFKSEYNKPLRGVLSLRYSRSQSNPQIKNPQAFTWGFFICKESDDDLLSHTYVHYHRRKVVSLSCSGWEGVGPTRYGRQT